MKFSDFVDVRYSWIREVDTFELLNENIFQTPHPSRIIWTSRLLIFRLSDGPPHLLRHLPHYYFGLQSACLSTLKVLMAHIYLYMYIYNIYIYTGYIQTGFRAKT